jgi:hypothetical protein
MCLVRSVFLYMLWLMADVVWGDRDWIFVVSLVVLFSAYCYVMFVYYLMFP